MGIELIFGANLLENPLKYLLCLFFFAFSLFAVAQADSVLNDSVIGGGAKISPESLAQDKFWTDTLNNDSMVALILPFGSRVNFPVTRAYDNFIEGKPRQQEKNNWRLLLIFIVLLALALSRVLFPGLLDIYTRAFRRQKSLDELFEEQKSEIGTFSIWMMLVSCLLYSFPLQFIAWRFDMRISDYAWGDYIFIFIALFTFFVVKFFLLIGLGRILESTHLASSLIFSSAYVHFVASFLCLPLFLFFWLNSYTLDAAHTGVLLGIILSALIILRLVRAIIQSAARVAAPLFYIILYLCALEIAPWLVIFKLLEINLN